MRSDRIILIALAAMLLGILVYRSRPDRVIPVPAASVVSAAPTGYVRIAGNVRYPGMYPVSANSMADGVIKMAEPVKSLTTGDVERLSSISVSSGDSFELWVGADGMQRVQQGVIPVSQRLIMKIPLDINVMTEEDFDRVPGIGPSMAHRIVVYRQNNGGTMTKNDLLAIEGIGEKKFLLLSRYFN